MIKSDRWIIRMGRDRQMIEPFEPKQVKVVDGKPVISYGVSSYGYDIRVGRTFKVLDPTASLTPTLSLQGRGQGRPEGEPRVRDGLPVIDPKNFDVSSFEDFEGDV